LKYKRLLINTKINDSLMINYASWKKGVDGVIIGDPFCLKRAGIGAFDIPRFARFARSKGLYVSYQSPVYLTSRNFDITVSLIENLVRDGLVDEIRVQEIGLLQSLGKIVSSGINITWSIYGYQREFPGMDIPLNQGQIDFLTSRGINSFEVTSAVAYSILKHRYPIKFKMQIHHYRFDPVTFSRNCYTGKFTGKCCCEQTVRPAMELLREEDLNIVETLDKKEKTLMKNLRDSEKLPCDELYYLQEEEGGRIKYVIEGHHILEFPEPDEFRELTESGMNFESLILSGNNIEEINTIIDVISHNY